MQIKIKKLFNTDGTHTTIEELYITLPKGLVDELGWEDGTLIEIERCIKKRLNYQCFIL